MYQEVYFSRVTKVDGSDDKYETSMDIETLEEHENKGLAIPYFPEYRKSMTEALIGHSIEELTKIESHLDKKLLQVVKGLLAALSYMTNPTKCDSWKSHSNEMKDKLKKDKILVKAFDWNENITINMSPFTKRLTKVTYYVEDGTVNALLDGERENNKCTGVIFFPMSEDVRQRFVCTVRVLSQILSALKPNKSFTNKEIDYLNGQTDEGIHEGWMFEVKSLGNALGYLVNCTSWRRNELLPFDEHEVKIKSGYRTLSEIESS